LPIMAAPATDRIELRIYRALTRLATPIAPALLRWRERRGKEDAARLGERLGVPSLPRPKGTLLWIHAASVGETSSVLPLVSQLIESRPDISVLLTSGTVTSARFAAPRLPARTQHQYVPLDSPAFVSRFLDYWRPSLAIFTEQEIWPNLVTETSRRRIPMALVNARMSEASFLRWQRRSRLATAIFSRFSIVLAQNEDQADRFHRLGAQRTSAAGNLKIDAPAPSIDPDKRSALNTAIGDRPHILAASTHASEELMIGEAHLRLRSSSPGLLTIVAPRHPERGEQIETELVSLGLRTARRTTGALPTPDTDVYIADTIGELGTLYSLSKVAFIGGSLIRHGGQNPIEAVRHGSAVVTGPHTHNFPDSFEALRAADGLAVVTDLEDLVAKLGNLLAAPACLEVMQKNAREALERMSGALDRSVATLLPLLPHPDAETEQRAV
jgi:3-deoxy-D-manno-octulosonic-acid transferase